MRKRIIIKNKFMEQRALLDSEIFQCVNLSGQKDSENQAPKDLSEVDQVNCSSENRRVMIPTNPSRIQKRGRKRREMSENSHWQDKDRRRYWLFYWELIMEEGGASWMEKKHDGTLRQMGIFLGKSREQCKSYDQRMKTKYWMRGGKDIQKVVRQKESQLRNQFPKEWKEVTERKQVMEDFWKKVKWYSTLEPFEFDLKTIKDSGKNDFSQIEQ